MMTIHITIDTVDSNFVELQRSMRRGILEPSIIARFMGTTCRSCPGSGIIIPRRQPALTRTRTCHASMLVIKLGTLSLTPNCDAYTAMQKAAPRIITLREFQKRSEEAVRSRCSKKWIRRQARTEEHCLLVEGKQRAEQKNRERERESAHERERERKKEH
jgi:hypothetical protein